MRQFRTFLPAAGAGAAIALLAACSNGSGFAPSSPGAGGGAAVNGVIGNPGRAQVNELLSAGWLSRDAQTAKSLLFVADQGNQRVEIFPQNGKNPSPIGQITDGISAPDGLFVDSTGTLYVCNFGSGTVTEYPKGQTTHSKTLTGAGSPKYVVVGVDGTVYVSDFHGSAGGHVYEYAGGSTSPTTTIQFSTFPGGLAMDRHNKLYVAYNDSQSSDIEVLKFTPGKTQGKNLGIHVKFGYAGGATIDHKGNLLVADQSRSLVDVFPPKATQPSEQITGFPIAYQIALNHLNKHLYVTAPSGSVAEVTYPAGTPIQTITNSLGGAYGVATSPNGSF